MTPSKSHGQLSLSLVPRLSPSVFIFRRGEGRAWERGYLSLASSLVPMQAPPSFPSLAVRKSGRGPGIIYHVSDVGVERRVERT